MHDERRASILAHHCTTLVWAGRGGARRRLMVCRVACCVPMFSSLLQPARTCAYNSQGGACCVVAARTASCVHMWRPCTCATGPCVLACLLPVLQDMC